MVCKENVSVEDDGDGLRDDLIVDRSREWGVVVDGGGKIKGGLAVAVGDRLAVDNVDGGGSV